MSKRSEENLRGIPMKPYDLLREGLIVLGILTVLVVILALFVGSPDYPTVRGEDVAKRQPVAFLKTSATILAGQSDLQNYGPPYTADMGNAQELFGLRPATWFGVTIPVDARQDLILEPLQRVAVMNPEVDQALQDFQAASQQQQDDWTTAYLSALDNAAVENGQVKVPQGDYGPVPTLMNGMLILGRAGLLEGALESGPQLPYTVNFTRSLLFFEGDVDSSVADTLDMTGEQWGVSHETGPYPGAWWLWPYTFFYQIPPMSISENADIQVMTLMGLLTLITILIPFIPILKNIPRWSGIYKLIWRDWYSGTGKRRAEEDTSEAS
ncbi:MAG: hypothetical protein P8074_09990 [Anaerolineales bacterium]|jgi:hypothetical protein